MSELSSALQPDSTPARPREAPLTIVIVGEVDHGKSTLIGRLLHETGSLPDGKLDELRRASERRGMPMEWSFVLDSLQAERDQAITIDTTRIWLRGETRDTVIVDAPGHAEFLKNMVSGAAEAEAAVLVVDAVEGLREQTRRHAHLLRLLGVDQVVVAVNKIDVAASPEADFARVAGDVASYLGSLGVAPAAIVPISAREGVNLAAPSPATPWYRGPTLLQALAGFRSRGDLAARPLRLRVQDVYKFDDRRILAVRVVSGAFRPGERLVALPGGAEARVASFEAFGEAPPPEARAGMSVGLTLDTPIFVERGAVLCRPGDAPPVVDAFKARIVWLSRRTLQAGDRLRLRAGTAEAVATVTSIEGVLDLETLQERPSLGVPRNAIARVGLRLPTPLAFEDHRVEPSLARFVLVEDFAIVAGGLADLEGASASGRLRSSNVTAVGHAVTRAAREARKGHRGAVIWLTGLSGAGKSTLALAAEQALFAAGIDAFVLDGDNLRSGLNGDLGFGPEARAENIRRVGEVAALFASAGTVAIAAFISPYAADRARARAAAGGGFHEVYVKASVETCEGRDPKGLYRRARAGEIADFTGISAPYEAPDAPDLVLDTEAEDADALARRLVEHVQRAVALEG